MEDLQVQKERLTHALFVVEIILAEMGLDMHEDVQDAYTALAVAVDEVVN
jgi:hypothetical protein